MKKLSVCDTLVNVTQCVFMAKGWVKSAHCNYSLTKQADTVIWKKFVVSQLKTRFPQFRASVLAIKHRV